MTKPTQSAKGKGAYPVKSAYPVKGANPVKGTYPVKGANPVKGAYPVKASQPAKAKESPGFKTPQVTKGKPNDPKKMAQTAKVKATVKGSGKLLHLPL